MPYTLSGVLWPGGATCSPLYVGSAALQLPRVDDSSTADHCVFRYLAVMDRLQIEGVHLVPCLRCFPCLEGILVAESEGQFVEPFALADVPSALSEIWASHGWDMGEAGAG